MAPGIEQVNTLAKSYTIPENVNIILEKACLDCHSNNTKHPWYNNIQPVGWWLNYHIKQSQEGLNFDEFLSYSHKKQDRKMEVVIEMVESQEMPLKYYKWMHADARLTVDERITLTNWATQVRTEIKNKTGFVPESQKEK